MYLYRQINVEVSLSLVSVQKKKANNSICMCQIASSSSLCEKKNIICMYQMAEILLV